MGWPIFRQTHFRTGCFGALYFSLLDESRQQAGSSGASHPLIWSMEMSGMSKKNGHTNHACCRPIGFPSNIINSVWWSQQSRARLSTLRHDLDLGATSKKALLPTDDRWSCVCCFQSQGPILQIRCLIKMEMGEEWWVIAYLMIVMIYYMYNSR